MNFLWLMILIWAAAMAAWFVVSRYVKSSDIDRIKVRLAGTVKAKAKKKTKGGAAADTGVIHKEELTKHRLAQALVLKYQLGPKLEILLEQAGIRWSPTRFVHMTLMLFLAGVAFGWLMLPFPKPFYVVTGLV